MGKAKRRSTCERKRMIARLEATTAVLQVARDAVLSRLTKREREILDRYLKPREEQ